jgi:hypothetical protein
MKGIHHSHGLMPYSSENIVPHLSIGLSQTRFAVPLGRGLVPPDFQQHRDTHVVHQSTIAACKLKGRMQTNLLREAMTAVLHELFESHGCLVLI